MSSSNAIQYCLRLNHNFVCALWINLWIIIIAQLSMNTPTTYGETEEETFKNAKHGIEVHGYIEDQIDEKESGIDS